MQHRTGRAMIVCLGLSAVALAACAPVAPLPLPPPPPPPPDVVCPANATPSQNEQAALVDPANGQPTVVTFQAATPAAVHQHVDQLKNQGDTVISVAPDLPVSALTPPNVDPSNDTDYGQQWGFGPNVMNFGGAWNTNLFDGNGGTPVRVGVIDTGVQGTHPDLDANVVAGKDFVSSDSASNFARVDGNGHGTHVAGIIAAEDNTEGVVGGAPHAQIVPVRVLDCQGSGSYSAVAAGILWASDSIANGGGGVQVINLSLGGGGFSQPLRDAVDMAISRGVVVVAAAGNGGAGAAPSYPGAFPEVLSVGAIDQAASAPFARASYSNDNTYIDVAAPGTQVHSTYVGSTYTNLSGTSMATPHISALAALIKEQCGAGYAVTTLINRIVTTAGNGPIPGFAGPVSLAKPDAATSPGLAC